MILTETNYILYGAHHYMNDSCTDTEEFMEDLKRIQLIKKIFARFKKSGEINERLVINHIVVLYNVFKAGACTNMLFFQMEEHWDCLKPILKNMGYLPNTIVGIKDDIILVDGIPENEEIRKRIKRIMG